MSALGIILAGSMAASTALVVLYLRWVFDTWVVPWPVVIGSAILSVIGLFWPWVMIALMVALVAVSLVVVEA